MKHLAHRAWVPDDCEVLVQRIAGETAAGGSDAVPPPGAATPDCERCLDQLDQRLDLGSGRLA